jgi:pimeloyl-ACP methyl ester carboxylesterase
MDSTRRSLLTTGAAAVAAAAAPRAFAQQKTAKEDATGTFYQKGNVRIHYQDSGTGFPLLVIPGGGLNSIIAWNSTGAPFNPVKELGNEFRCITTDLRNANTGQSSGPLEVDRPWDAYADDQLGVMDHLGIKRFMVLGFCIGGPFIWNLLKRAPDRIVAAVCAQPSGFRKEMPTLSYDGNMKGWGPELVKRRPDITMEMVDRFLTSMYLDRSDFVYTVTRDFVRSCKTPVLILPDDIPAHPYVVAMESAMLAPRSEVSLYPWKDTKDKIPLAVRHVRSFLRVNRPSTA